MSKRIDAHRIETESTNIVRELFVDEALFREISERDYGVDGLVEFFNHDGSFSGDGVLVQIKGSRSIIAKKGFVRTPSIRTETVKYWAQKKQPVYILFVDVSRKIIYFEDAKLLARANAKKVSSQKTISFRIREGQAINSKDLLSFRHGVFIAEKFDQARIELAKVIFTFREIYKKLIVNAGRNCFMVIDHDDPRINLLDDYSKTFQLCWYFFGIHAEVHNFNHFSSLSYEIWKQEYVEMHITETADYLREQFRLLMIVVVALKEVDSDYWEEHDRAVSKRLNDSDDLRLINMIIKKEIGIKNIDLLNEYF